MYLFGGPSNKDYGIFGVAEHHRCSFADQPPTAVFPRSFLEDAADSIFLSEGRRLGLLPPYLCGNGLGFRGLGFSEHGKGGSYNIIRYHMVVSQNKGIPTYTQHTIVPIIGAPKKVSLVWGEPSPYISPVTFGIWYPYF